MKRVNLTGNRFGRLVALSVRFDATLKKTFWFCQCDCGNQIEVRQSHLGRYTKSCGCLRIERNTKRMKKRMAYLSNRKVAHFNNGQIGYMGIHAWVRRHKEKPPFCEHCHKNPPLDLANISGSYLKDINDYEYLCRRCHQIQDGRMNILAMEDYRICLPI